VIVPRVLLGLTAALLVVVAAGAVALAPRGEAETGASRSIALVDSPLPVPPVLERRAFAVADAERARTRKAQAQAEADAAARARARRASRARSTASSRAATARADDAAARSLESAELPAGPNPKGDKAIVTAEVLKNGIALPPFEAPMEVRAIIESGNQIARTPYKWGGGHGKWKDDGYDCSGSVSYALASAGLLGGPLTSGGLMSWGKPGKGKWITVWTNPGHVFLEVAGVRFDTSGTRRTGSRWQSDMRPTSGYVARHPPGL
jgi:cell wall-associated NlpC family hydrolase